MKVFKILFSVLLISHLTSCQDGSESTTLFSNSNIGKPNKPDSLYQGLLYSKETMVQLEAIVDSVNVDFLNCGLDRDYYSERQAKGVHVFLEKSHAKKAKTDIESGISLEEFKKRYPSAKTSPELLIIRYNYLDYEGTKLLKFMDPTGDYEIKLMNKKDLFRNDVKATWVCNKSLKSISAFFFKSDFESEKLDEKYARMVQYSECLIDTNTTLYLHKNIEHEWDENSLINQFMGRMDMVTDKPEDNFDDFEAYYEAMNVWDSLKTDKVIAVLENDPQLISLFQRAIEEGLSLGGSNEMFEAYVGEFYSKEMSLELKRGRKVYGSCSMDNSPIMHAKEIAVLSAETKSWNVFLRAHLNIMNDNFSRASDASYAWEKRKTYARELELLNINLTDLIIGVCLRIDDDSENHYYGYIGRMGRAISELENSEKMIKKITFMLKDDNLDDYNRLLMAYLYLNFISYTEGDEKLEHKGKMLDLLDVLPKYFHNHILHNLPKEN